MGEPLVVLGAVVRHEPAHVLDEAEDRYAEFAEHPHRAAGIRLFKVLEDNIAQRDITILLETPAKRLITDASGAVCGLRINTKNGTRNIKANHAVILACGGFETLPYTTLPTQPYRTRSH